MIFLQCGFFGKAVIASRNMSAIDYVRDGHNGLLVPPGNADELAAKVTILLEDARLLSMLGNNARCSYDEYSNEGFWTNLNQIVSEQMD